jgi:uncharacterized membrane protein
MTFLKKTLASDERGAVAVLAGLSFVLMVGFAALAVDVGTFYFQKRDLQTFTDLAAIAAANSLTDPQQAATDQLTLNGYAAGALQSVETGLYTANSAIPAAERFQAQANGANAVLVTTQVTAPMYFGGALQALVSGAASKSGVTIGAQAIAMQQAEASFAIGTDLATLNGGIVNDVLGGLIGANLSLSAVSYQSLISTQIDLFSFSNALATRANLTGVTYNSLANSNVSVANVFGAMVDAAQASSPPKATAIAALASIASTQAGASGVMQLSSLINYGPFAQSPVGSQGLIGATVSAFDLLSAAAQVANGQHQVQTALSVNLPGVAAVSLMLSIGERPVGTSWATIGSAGASVYTAQVRLLLIVQLLGSGSIGTVTLPVYIAVASGTATLNAIQCSSSNLTASSVTLGVTPGIVDAWIGNVTAAQLSNFTSAPSPSAATLVNLAPIATVTGLAHATIANTQATPVTFSYADILADTKQTVSTTDYTASLLSSLVGDLQLNVKVLGLGLGLPSNLTQSVASTAAGAVSPIDQILANVLGAAGVGLGNADTWVMGLNCSHSVLVN